MPINLLVIDDEETIRSLWCDIFEEDERYTIDTAEDGEEGISKFKKGNYDIVITDLNMPGGISGIDIVKEVKEIKPETEIMIMTAYGTIELAVRAMKEGAYEFILKPLDFVHIDFLIQKCYQQMKYKRENEELKDLNVRLKELNEEKEKFIAITSHELRTPTSTIVGLVDVINEGIISDLGDKYENEFGMLMAASNNLRDIVNDMHDLSIAKEGGLNLNKQDFNINELEEELIMEYKLSSQDRNLKFQIDNRLNKEEFSGDLRRIKQATSEIIQNAIKYTKDNGTITVKLDKEQTNGNQNLTIEVADTGIGIPRGKIDKIFSEFYEVQNSMVHHTSKTEFMGGGMGLGLSIVKEIVKAHDGEIKVETEPGKGSRFKIFLPFGAGRKLEQVGGKNQ